jgi:chromosome partitioning protein
MYVVALVTQKGGSGKSTLTVGLAVAAMEDANRVAVIEADSQGTVSRWSRRRTNPSPRVDRVADRVEIERASRPRGSVSQLPTLQPRTTT